MIKKTQRFERATKIAHWTEVQRIYYAAPLRAFIHSWALVVISIFVPAALTVFQFLAALNRASKNGYAGVAVAYELLAPQIQKATERKCSVRTLQRGVAVLVKMGLVQLHWWTMPTIQLRNGTHEHEIAGTDSVKTPTGWTSQQIRIIVLTRVAIGLWDRATRNKRCDIIPHFAPFLRPAKLAASPKIDQIDKSIMIEATTSKIDMSSSHSQRRIQEEELEGNTTRPDMVTSSPPTPLPAVEHDSSNLSIAQTNEQSNQLSIGKGAFEEDLIQKLAESANSEPKPKPKTEPKKAAAATRGVSHNPPKIPRNVSKSSWVVARAMILNEIATALSNHPRRDADLIYERARYEMSAEYPKGFPTCIDWAYWIGRWAGFLPQQRRGHIYRDILPLLKTRVVVIPSEPNRFVQHTEQYTEQQGKPIEKGVFDPLLDRLFKKFCGK